MLSFGKIFKKIKKSHTCEEGGHTSKFLFSIYWWTWKTTIYKKTIEAGQ